MSEKSTTLEPLATLTGGLLRVLVGLFVLLALLDLFDVGPIHVRLGSDACVTAADTTFVGDDLRLLQDGAREGVDVQVSPRYCAPHPSGYQRFLGALAERPAQLLLLGGLFLLDRVLRGALKEGFHTARVAARLRVLAWWLLLGALTEAVLSAQARAALLSTLAVDRPLTVGAWLLLWNPPYLLLLTGLGVLTFARTVRASAVMREDLEGTV